MTKAPRILVLGGDGYLGWPLTLKLGSRYPKASITLVDNGLRRRLVAEVGSRAAVPILALADRVHAARRLLGQRQLRVLEMDVSEPGLDALVSEFRPTHVYHLAQQASAPYSMRDPEAALFTVRNNEHGNLRLLWALQRHAPQAHLIKLGSFGEYARSEIPVAEGYFAPSYRGIQAKTTMPYPRAANDIYHVTKINDSNFVSMACEQWDLRITELMQATVVGTHTEEMAGRPELFTRFDYDEAFGTVLNRFICMLLIEHPLLVYGSGHQRTGLMALADCVASMASLVEQPVAAGEHRVLNHVTERRYSIAELADKVVEVAREVGYAPRIQRGVHDPRNEQPPSKLTYDIETSYVDSHLAATPLDRIIRESIEHLGPHVERIDARHFPPVTRW